MKSLVLYFSRSGNTKAVAEMIAREAKADIEEIKEQREARGLLGYIKSAFLAARKKNGRILPLQKDLKKYERIFIGQPVWSWTMVPAVRALAKQYSFKGKDIRLFCTMDGSGGDRCLDETERQIGRAGARAVFLKPRANPEKSMELVKKLVRD